MLPHVAARQYEVRAGSAAVAVPTRERFQKVRRACTREDHRGAVRASLVSKFEGHQHEAKRERNDPALVSDMRDCVSFRRSLLFL
jgi:hypothetical protein